MVEEVETSPFVIVGMFSIMLFSIMSFPLILICLCNWLCLLRFFFSLVVAFRENLGLGYP